MVPAILRVQQPGRANAASPWFTHDSDYDGDSTGGPSNDHSFGGLEGTLYGCCQGSAPSQVMQAVLLVNQFDEHTVFGYAQVTC